jgi:uncharacterized protein
MNNEQLFEWDEANISHLARHGISPAEAEDAILDPHALLLEIQAGGEERVKAVGLTSSGRIVVVVFTLRGEAIRPITAYEAPIRMQQIYLRGEGI